MDNATATTVRWVTHCPDPDGWSERIARNSVLDQSGCQVWTGSVDRRGYGKFTAGPRDSRIYTGAHRASWLSRVGDIPDGLVLDHLCRNPLCVNVDHLEVVTNQVNTLRGDHSAKAGRSGTRPGKQIFSCRIHARENGYMTVRKNGYRIWVCRICRNVRVKAWRARQAEQK